MKKNLMITMLLVSVVLVSSFVFAGITGYAVKQGDIQYFDDAQVDVIVKEVYRSGATEVLVTNDLGKTEVVIVPKDGTAKTSAGVEITVENAVRKTFGKDVATVSVEALPVLSRFSGADSVAGTGVGTGIHTHLVDFTRRWVGIEPVPESIYSQASNIQGAVGISPLPDSTGIGGGTVQIVGNSKDLQIWVQCGFDEVALGGGYSLGGIPLDNNGKPTYVVTYAGPITKENFPEGYEVVITEAYEKASTNYVDELGIQSGNVYATCARLESAPGASTAHF